MAGEEEEIFLANSTTSRTSALKLKKHDRQIEETDWDFDLSEISICSFAIECKIR